MGQGLAEGPGGAGMGGGLSPCEAHVERRAGGARAAAAVTLFLARWLLLGEIQGVLFPRQGEPATPCGRPRHMDGWEGGPPSSPPLWHLWGQGAVFYQAPACHRTVPAVSSWASGGQSGGPDRSTNGQQAHGKMFIISCYGNASKNHNENHFIETPCTLLVVT